jgi:hypothetical protein
MIFQLQEDAEAYERMYETDMSWKREGDIFICHRFGGGREMPLFSSLDKVKTFMSEFCTFGPPPNQKQEDKPKNVIYFNPPQRYPTRELHHADTTLKTQLALQFPFLMNECRSCRLCPTRYEVYIVYGLNVNHLQYKDGQHLHCRNDTPYHMKDPAAAKSVNDINKFCWFESNFTSPKNNLHRYLELLNISRNFQNLIHEYTMEITLRWDSPILQNTDPICFIVREKGKVGFDIYLKGAWQCCRASCGAVLRAPLQKCGRCKTVAYCSKNCQILDWKLVHRQECDRLSIQRDDRALNVHS